MMTSRERVRATLNHEVPDRVPVDIGSTRVSGIAAVAYRKLLQHLRRDEDVRLYDIKQQLADPSLEVIDSLGGDVVGLHRLGPTTGMPFLRIDRWQPSQLTDGTPCVAPEGYEPVFRNDGMIEVLREGKVFARRTPESLYFDVCAAPLAGAETQADLDAYQWPDPWTEREERFLQKRIEELYHGTDKAVFGGLPLLDCSFFEGNLTLFGYENFMMLLATNRELVEYWLDKQLVHDFEILEPYLKVVGPYIEAIQMNDDYGAQDALQISAEMYRELFKPRQQKWIEFVRARTKAKIFIHCDGAVEEILPDFIEIGIEILNPVQTSARGMDPQRLKRKYGRHLSFWGGGVETQSTLPFGTVDDVRREVRERVALLGQNGGYVFATIHNIQPDIPAEKIVAVFDTVRECGDYSES